MRVNTIELREHMLMLAVQILAQSDRGRGTRYDNLNLDCSTSVKLSCTGVKLDGGVYWLLSIDYPGFQLPENEMN